MYARQTSDYLKKIRSKYKCITLIGPRQSGKTTLSKTEFSDFEYYSLEQPNTREYAIQDPVGFLNNIKKNVILDEIQKTPDLLSYLQSILDDPKNEKHFILTGSNSIQLSDKVSQSLAGRTRILNLLPLRYSELPETSRSLSLNEVLWNGFYPRIFIEKLNPIDWYSDYFQTYVEKDVRLIKQIENLNQFDRFVRLCAGRVGQLTNYSSLATEAGIKQPTAVSWFGLLQVSFIAFTLEPHFKNFNKRMIKSPKIYFYDTGLLCYLLRIQSPEQLENHPLKSFIFENFIIIEKMKSYFNKGQEAPLYFWRDQHGHEVDLIIENSDSLYPIEIKCSETFNSQFIDHINWLNDLQKKSDGEVVYSGNEDFKFKEIQVSGWRKFVNQL